LTSNQELSPIVLVVTFFIAMGLGALHAFSPGTAKRWWERIWSARAGIGRTAVFLGLIVTITPHGRRVCAGRGHALSRRVILCPTNFFRGWNLFRARWSPLLGFGFFVERFRGGTYRDELV